LSRSSTLFLHSLVPLRAQEVPTTLLPGLVDLHNHGGGAGFPEACTPEHARVAIGEHLRHGTTSLVASLVTATPDTLRQRVGLLTALAESDELAGIHLEGPFLSTARCGAQDPDLIQTPDAAWSTNWPKPPTATWSP
jgi:N-acetylglucosamine-6-phosphate deacetylase